MYKLGDLKGGRRFWCYRPPNKAGIRLEVWVSDDEYERRIHKNREKQRAYCADPEKYAAIIARRKSLYITRDQRVKLWRSAKIRAREKGLPFTITYDDIPYTTHCPIFGIEFVQGIQEDGCRDAWSSLDEIIHGEGYVPGNVVVVSHLANLLKNKATPAQLRQLADFYEMIT